MRITAEELARSTHALLIGVGRFEISGPDELAAARDAKRLQEVLSDPAACGLPTDQVISLVDDQATGEQVRNQLRALVDATDTSSTLLIYFSGHGHRIHDLFLIHLFDTDPDQVAQTGLSAKQLTEILSSSPARGVLVIMDCCVSAGFAETAPEFFFDLGDRDYRIALSASRSGQKSWEIPGDSGSLFTKHLVRLLDGRLASGHRPGEITYLGLIESLSFAINEDLTSWRPNLPSQELVANGATVSDPLLFVSARAAMKGLSVKTARVSREYMRYVLMRSALWALALILVVIGIFAGWISAHEYAVADDKETTVYQGYPGMRAFGYPQTLTRLNYAADDYRPSSPLARNLPLVRMGPDAIYDAVYSELNAAHHASDLAQSGRLDAARELLRQGPDRPPLEMAKPYRLWAQTLRLRLSTREQLRRVTRNLRHEASEIRETAVITFLDVDREAALDFLTDDLKNTAQRHNPRHVLVNLKPPCTQKLRKYLSSLAQDQRLFNFSDSLLLTWWRVECPVELPDIRALAQGYDFDLVERIARWASMMQFQDPAAILDDIDLDLTRRLSFAVGWPEMPCLPRLLEGPELEHPLAKIQLIRYATQSCLETSVQITASEKLIHLTLVDDQNHRLLELSLPVPLETVDNADASAFHPVLKLLSEIRPQSLESSLMDYILGGEKTMIAEPTLRLARHLDIPWRSGQAFIRGGNHQQLALEYYLWWRESNSETVDKIAFERLGDGRSSYFLRYFAQVGPTEQMLETLRIELEERQNLRTEASARLLAMFGTPSDLDNLAARLEPRLRFALVSHGVFNPEMPKWRKDSTSKVAHPVILQPGTLQPDVAAQLDRNLEKLTQLQSELSSLAPDLQCLWIELELAQNAMAGYMGQYELLPPGIRMFLENERKHCGFYAEV